MENLPSDMGADSENAAADKQLLSEHAQANEVKVQWAHLHFWGLEFCILFVFEGEKCCQCIAR